MSGFGVYRLGGPNGHTPILCVTEEEQRDAYRAFGTNRHVGQDIVMGANGEEVLISTVFLVLNHAIFKGQKDELFETLVFGGEMNDHMERCATWDEAVAQHKKVVEEVKVAEFEARLAIECRDAVIEK